MLLPSARLGHGPTVSLVETGRTFGPKFFTPITHYETHTFRWSYDKTNTYNKVYSVDTEKYHMCAHSRKIFFQYPIVILNIFIQQTVTSLKQLLALTAQYTKPSYY